MKYLPLENLTYSTSLSPQEALDRIAAVTEPAKGFRLTNPFSSKSRLPYEGHVRGDSFNITRIIGYRNSFLPRIKGQVSGGLGRTSLTKVRVTMRLHPFVLAFMGIWLCGVGVFMVVGLVAAIERGSFDSVVLIPIGMLVFGYGLATGAFKFESGKTKRDLASLLEARLE